MLTEVGDEQVIEELEGVPDPAHGPSTSASMMAGPISETISHSDGHGEIVPVSQAASKAAQVEALAARSAKPAATKTAPRAKAVKAPGMGLMSVPAVQPAKAGKAAPKEASTKAAVVKPAAKPAETTPVVKTAVVKPTVAKAPAKAAPAPAPKKQAEAPKAAGKVPAPKASAAAKPVAVKADAKAPAKPAPKAAAKPVKVAAAAPATKLATAPTKSVAAKPLASKPAAPKIANVLAAPRGGVADRLIDIKGIGPVNEKKLNEHGIFHFDQVASWKKADVAAAEAYLAFDGRIGREDWVGQAKALARDAAKAAKAKRGGGK